MPQITFIFVAISISKLEDPQSFSEGDLIVDKKGAIIGRLSVTGGQLKVEHTKKAACGSTTWRELPYSFEEMTQSKST